MNLTLQFVSLDDRTQADCPTTDDTSVVFPHAAVYVGRAIPGNDANMLQASEWQRWEGQLVRDRGRDIASGRGFFGERGRCKVYGFPTALDRDAFCELTGAVRARFTRAVALTR